MILLKTPVFLRFGGLDRVGVTVCMDEGFDEVYLRVARSVPGAGVGGCV